jgi:putative ABC transport system permease protein
MFYLFRDSLADFKRNKVRTVLTSLGILIGVFSVVMLLALGVGLKNYIQQQFEDLGANQIYIFPGQLIRDGQFRNSESIESPISFDSKDVRNLSRLEGVNLVVPAFTTSVEVQSQSESKFGDLYATTADVFILRNMDAQAGEVFNEGDVDKNAKVAVMGPKIAEELYGTPEAAVGKSVRIGNSTFKVIGVTVSKGGGGFGGPSFDTYIYVPYTAAGSLNESGEFGTISVQAVDEESVGLVKEEIQRELEKRYEETEFTVLEQTEILNIVSQIFGILNAILIAIGSISLVVGGIGIMNIMYASVTERTKEIGIRRAIGATQKDILLQFMSQSLLLSIFGGILGLLIASAIVILINPYFPAVISPVAVVLAIGISGAIGVFFGVFPARRAANLSPIDAIRYE